MATAPATVADFKARFVRDFLYSATPALGVTDAELTSAIAEAMMMFNTALWDSVEDSKVAFLYVVAHFLVLSIQAAGGLAGGAGLESQGDGVISSAGAGPVNASFALPESLTKSPILNQFMRTNYGLKYLQLVTPRLAGNVGVAEAWTDPGEIGGD